MDAVLETFELTKFYRTRRRPALDRITLAVEPGTAVALVGSDAPDKFEAWLAAAAAMPEDGWTRAEREAHLRDEYSTFTWLIEPMLERVGFELLAAAHDLSGMYAAWTCRKS